MRHPPASTSPVAAPRPPSEPWPSARPGTCGFLVLFLRAGDSGATSSPAVSDDVTSTEQAYDDSFGDEFFGGGEIGQPSQSSSFPQARSGTS